MRGTDEILARVSAGVPRYTSYPTAPQFRDDFAAPALARLLDAARSADSVSVYIHIPYCDRLCWFCGCHTSHTLKYQPVDAYVGVIEREIALWSRAIGVGPRLSALHLGGGSPSLLRAREFRRLSRALRDAFEFRADAEISVELDPSDVNGETIAGLGEIGMTRASIGVQDFDPDVQAAINRPQGYEETRRVVDALRAFGIRSLNIDALYGLPRQTTERLLATIDQVLLLSPDRIALFGYAHMPWLKKHQRLIEEAELPGSAERLQQSGLAAERIATAGYRRIGIDHFAKPGDSLALAQEAGRLRRNFQGYTSDNAVVLIGIGASAISQCASAIVQNAVAAGQHRSAIHAGRLAVARGIPIDRDDRVRARIIERLMCDFGFGYDDLRNEFGVDALTHVAMAKRIAAADGDGLSESTDREFRVAADARPFARVVASCFDAYLDNAQGRFSKAV